MPTWRLWRDEPVRERVIALGKMQAERLDRFRPDPRFENLRRLGTGDGAGPQSVRSRLSGWAGTPACGAFPGAEVLLRPLGNTIYVLPPYCITGAELDMIYDAIASCA